MNKVIPNLDKVLAFASPEDLSRWLEKNHDKESELWIKVFKKSSKITSVTWNEVVIETLRWGWIDGMKKSLDAQAYLQRITPRKPRSNWSLINTRHVEKLIGEGRMQEPGLEQVRAAKADGRWQNAYAPASELKVPSDFVDALAELPREKEFFESLTKSSRYAIAYGLATAKKAETRERRFNKFVDMLSRGERPGFGFKK